MIVVKRLFRYLCGTADYVICYQGRLGLKIFLDVYGFVDAEWVRDLDQIRSTSGYVFKLFGESISWMSKKQVVVALSIIEVEYMEATHGSKEVVWLQRMCSNSGFEQQVMSLDCDIHSAIFSAKNPSYHSKTKYIDVQWNFVRDRVESKKVLSEKVHTL